MGAASDPHLDPQLLPLLEGFPDIPLDAQTLPGFRDAIAGMAVLPDPASHPGVAIDQVHVPGAVAGTTVRCLQFRPAGSPAAATLLHVHGGGYVMGLPEMDAARNVMLVEKLGCAILSVDYRLAPEHPHPAALEDCHAALVWLAARSGRVGLIGESAGAGLAASLALLARERGSAQPACMALMYPMLTPPGHEVPATAQDARIGRYIWPEASNRFGWQCLLGGAGAQPATLAGFAADLSGLPPSFIAAAGLDLFVHDNLELASRLMRAGNDVELHCYARAFHGFDRAVDAAVSRRFTRDLLDFLSRGLGPD